jgi:urease accessory protein
MHRDWLIWQIIDSAFPTGGFAHSAGLEAAWQQGELASDIDVSNYLRTSMEQAAAGALTFVLAVCREPHRFEELDALQDAMLSNHIANRASRAQGKALLATSVRVLRLDALTALQSRVRNASLPAHVAPVWGAVAAATGIEPPELSQMFIFMHLRSLVNAAVRLGIVGPMQAQTIQQGLSTHGSALAVRALNDDVEQAAQTAPLLDLLHTAHDRLYSKLFIS